MGLPNQLLSLLFVFFLSAQIEGTRLKRMFALCPPHFVRIGNECYFISQDRVNWLDAHFECKDRNSRLAEPFKQEDRFLRKYLNHLTGLRPSDLWIGARFNWERNKWQWGHNGMDLTYQSFSQTSAHKKDLRFHCAILNPNLKYRWSASSCELQHQYICQHRMPYVNEKNRIRIYNKWNTTYPNEMANEIEFVLSEDDLLRRRRKMQHRSHLRSQMHNRQTKDGHSSRRRNDIPFNNLHRRDQMQHPRKTRIGNKRHRFNETSQQFNLNRSRAGGIRQPIHFNSKKDWQPNSTIYEGRRKNKLAPTTTNRPGFTWAMYDSSTNTRAPTTTTTTTTTPIPSRPTTTPQPTTTTTSTTTTTTETPTRAPDIWLSNDVNDNDEQIQKRYEENLQRQYDEEQRKKQEYLNKVRRIEEEQRQNQDKIRENHLKLMEKRRLEMIAEQKQLMENERIQEERRQQDAERRRQNEHNKMLYETQLNQRNVLIEQRKQQENHDDERAIQTNEILDDESTTISSSITTTTTTTTMTPIEKKRLKNKRLRDRLSKLSVEQQNLFFQKRAERHKKRGAHGFTADENEPETLDHLDTQ